VFLMRMVDVRSRMRQYHRPSWIFVFEWNLCFGDSFCEALGIPHGQPLYKILKVSCINLSTRDDPYPEGTRLSKDFPKYTLLSEHSQLIFDVML
jgi:hypothetical protein